ncbi:pilus assembly protein PilP [Halomonas eurihalina]|uniref:Pilus assembly protein PilP n=1 Tax=Halomonas eurihalina TaxID=42566 RepID=A0A5D9D5J2_HALER|nr:pilus assembly protein PilP [Halomonas eurihalina]MDR5858985.1 pilus assembly protein PilP [Halomonas eurihalina]TZG39488.1 pilus assembly protein PilP [Halomonas eurihalina]
MMRWVRVAALGLGVLSGGCHDAGLDALERQLVAWRADAVATAVEEVSALPAPVAASYRFANSPNPFSVVEPVSARRGVAGVSPDRAPLEGYALEALTLVGTLSTAGEAWVLVKTPEGNVHRLGIGGRLGRHQGRIVAISGTRVHLMEKHPDGNGGWNERDVILGLDG